MILMLLLVQSCHLAAAIADRTLKIQDICLQWKLQDDELTLSCKVRNLIYAVVIYDPFREEQGFCLPNAGCTTLHPGATMSQNLSTSETVFTLRGKIDQSVNGKWKCQHGINYDASTADVFVPKKTDKKLDKKTYWQIPVSYTAMSLISTYLLIQLLISTCNLKQNRRFCIGRIIQRTVCRKICLWKKTQLNAVLMQVVFLLMAASMFYVVGQFGHNKNDVPLYIGIGVFYGFVMFILVPDKSDMMEAAPCNVNYPDDVEENC